MTLIKSISGIRGTIGGTPGDHLTPVDLVAFTTAFANWLLTHHQKPKIVIGRDGRKSGEMVKQIVTQTLVAKGVNVVDLDYSTTPTVEMYVPHVSAQGGIIITASHNPMEWNALKFLNAKGEFINAAEGQHILDMSEAGKFEYETIDLIGKVEKVDDAIAFHVDRILELPLVNTEAIRNAKFSVVVDCINSTGAISIPVLLEALGVQYHLINQEISGSFAHNPEPLKAHLHELSATVVDKKADLGIVVDPDVDRLAFISEDGEMFGEEYTIVAIADYILPKTGGHTVSNLSSTQALRDVTLKHGFEYHASAVGEVNVVSKMKAVNAVFGGEGNGGVIYPALHYGRDALVGIAFFLSLLAERNVSASALKQTYPSYTIAKNKIQLEPGMDVDAILLNLKQAFLDFEIDTTDGVKIIMEGEWIHMRKSNTEPIIRLYSEAQTEARANELANMVQQKVNEILKVH